MACLFGEREVFIAQDLGDRTGVKAMLARKALYVLHKLGVVEQSGK
jgi:ribosomal protein S25